MKMLCLFEKNSVGILLIRQDLFTAKNLKVLMDFLKTKRIFARGVQNVLGINETPLLSWRKLLSFPKSILFCWPLSSSKSWTL